MSFASDMVEKDGGVNKALLGTLWLFETHAHGDRAFKVSPDRTGGGVQVDLKLDPCD